MAHGMDARVALAVLVCAALGCTQKSDEDGESVAGSSGGANAAGASAGTDSSVSAGQSATAGSSSAAGTSAQAGAAGASGWGAGSGGTSGSAGSSGSDGGMIPVDGSLPPGDGGDDPPALYPIDPPVPDDCITDVSAGDHKFNCGGVTFHVLVHEQCTTNACGLIFDVHGGTMSGLQMRDNTQLHELAPEKGYLVVHPSAIDANTGGSWDLAAQPPVMGDFMDRMIAAFHVDPARVHVTGFSQGSGVTFWFLCNKHELLASTGPISGQSADQITVEGGGNCLESIDADWQPRVPILFMNGLTDTALVIENARARVDGLVSRLSLTGGEEIESGTAYNRKRWQGEGGMILDYIEHDYGGQAVLGGHCIPGGTDIPGAANNFGLNATTCTTGDIELHWGEIVLKWFEEHPKR